MRVERSGPAAVPFKVIDVPFRRDVAASSARSVAFSFIHTNDMPGLSAFPVSPWSKNALRRPQIGVGVNHQIRVVFMRIAMIGTGYVGLVSGACFADFGHQVTCVDKDAGKIEALRRGEIPIFEPGLDALVASNASRGRLDFTTDLTAAVEGAEAVFIAVGTPTRRGDGHADLTFVFEAVRELAKVIAPGTVVVTKSTVPVGTGDEIERILKEEEVEQVSVASNPEF